MEKSGEMSDSLIKLVSSRGSIPLSWVSKTSTQNYLNLGDALSPVMVAFLSGLPVSHVAAKSSQTRLAAVGTIGHMFEGGDVSFWGTGTSPHLNPNQSDVGKVLYSRPRDTKVTVYATRGPFTRKILAPDLSGPGIYGDPLWLLPRFHTAPVEKRYELGVILHLSELADRSYEAVPKPDYRRYCVSPGDRGAVKLLNTVTKPTVAALRERLDEILLCKRIVSTSLHGMVFAESYGIPCLYFSPRAADAGLGRVDLISEEGIDLRFNDLYRGLGQTSLDVWYQPRRKATNWEAVIRAIDEVWFPKGLDEEALVHAFPLPVAPLPKGKTGSAFDHPMINGVPTGKAAGLTGAPSWLKRLATKLSLHKARP